MSKTTKTIVLIALVLFGLLVMGLLGQSGTPAILNSVVLFAWIAGIRAVWKQQ